MATELGSAIDQHHERYHSFSGRQLTNAFREALVTQLRSKVGSARWFDAIAREQALQSEIESRM